MFSSTSSYDEINHFVYINNCVVYTTIKIYRSRQQFIFLKIQFFGSIQCKYVWFWVLVGVNVVYYRLYLKNSEVSNLSLTLKNLLIVKELRKKPTNYTIHIGDSKLRGYKDFDGDKDIKERFCLRQRSRSKKFDTRCIMCV